MHNVKPDENKTKTDKLASTWKCHLSIPRFESFPELSFSFSCFAEEKKKIKTQLNDNLLSSFPLRSGISKPVFPTGDTLRSVGNGRPLVLSSDSWYICLCTGCRCQFSPKRCMAAKVETQHPQSWLNLPGMQRLLKGNSDMRKGKIENNRKGSPKEAGQCAAEWSIAWFFKSADQ